MSKNNTLLRAAVAGLLGASALAAVGAAEDKKMEMGKKVKMDVVPCYGVNMCKGHGQCGGENHGCAGGNSCKGQGWLYMPKSSCEALEGGSLKPIAKKAAEKGEKKSKEKSKQ